MSGVSSRLSRDRAARGVRRATAVGDCASASPSGIRAGAGSQGQAGPSVACSAVRSRAVGLVLGAVADAVFADPARWHPVAGFGSCAAALERRWYADRPRRRACATQPCWSRASWGWAWRQRRRPGDGPSRTRVATAVATWAVLGGTSLAAHGRALAALLDAADPRRTWTAARALIPALCGRDPQSLDAAGMARAGTESMAENTSDAAVAPLLWGAVRGHARAARLPRDQHPRRDGRLPLAALPAVRLGGGPRRRRGEPRARRGSPRCCRPGSPPRSADRRARPWPRGAATPGHTRAPTRARSRRLRRERSAWGSAARPPTRTAIEDRPRLGSGPPPTPIDLRRAARLSRLVAAAATVLACAVAAIRSGNAPG